MKTCGNNTTFERVAQEVDEVEVITDDDIQLKLYWKIPHLQWIRCKVSGHSVLTIIK